jgi:outer membrane lipoprotein SlyB
MSKTLSLALLAAGLTLSGIADASASEISAGVYGDGSRVRTTGYGDGAPADFVIEGDDNDVEVFAGPCPGGRRSQTILRGSGQHRVLIAPCIVD